MKFNVDHITVQLTPREARVIESVLSMILQDDPLGRAAQITGLPIQEINSTYLKFTRSLDKILIQN
jgi:hypothetical protein